MVTIYPTGVTIHKPCYEGNTLYCFNGKAILIDIDGQIVNQWTTTGYHAEFKGVNLLTLAQQNSGSVWDCAKIIELDNSGNNLWQYVPSGFTLHHDFQLLANGNIMLLCRKLKRVPAISSQLIYDDFLTEITPGGTIVWQWFTSTHFNEFNFSSEARNLIAQNRDWAHTNSFYVLDNNNIIVSQRHTNKIFQISKTSGEIIWQCDITIGQHNLTMLSNGNILVLDNGGKAGYPEQSRLYSRVIEIIPDKTVAWQYNATCSWYPLEKFFTSFMGSAQRLPNGNTLINEAVNGRFFEVTNDGEIVWEYINPNFATNEQGLWQNTVYRCWRM